MKKPIEELYTEVTDARRAFVGKIYRHWKGNLYKVDDIAVDCNTNELVVVYHLIDWYEMRSGIQFLRPLSQWEEEVSPDTPRFVQVKKTELYLSKAETMEFMARRGARQEGGIINGPDSQENV